MRRSAFPSPPRCRHAQDRTNDGPNSPAVESEALQSSAQATHAFWYSYVPKLVHRVQKLVPTDFSLNAISALLGNRTGFSGSPGVERGVDAPVHAPLDAGVHAPPDAPVHPGKDALPHAPHHALVDAGVDALLHAPAQTPLHAPVESPLHAGVDAPLDAPVERGACFSVRKQRADSRQICAAGCKLSAAHGAERTAYGVSRTAFRA